MNYDQLMKELESLGTQQNRKIYKNHGGKDPMFGVKASDIKKYKKYVKKDFDLALQLINSGNYDAMHLGILYMDPKFVTKELLNNLAMKVNCYMLAEYALPKLAAQTNFAFEISKEWIDDEDELIRSCGFSTLSMYISINEVNFEELNYIDGLMDYIKNNIHNEKNRVKYTMNGFIISVGAYINSLTIKALDVSKHIGKVNVYMGNTGCKVPLAEDYINKMIITNKVGVKRKKLTC